MKLLPTHLVAGIRAERYAEKYLRRQGLRLKHRNYRCRASELDLVMQDRDTLVFVEVRHRRNGNYGGALQSVTMNKQRRLVKAANEYLLKQKIAADQTCRFDIVAVEGDLEQPRIEWITNAFDAH